MPGNKKKRKQGESSPFASSKRSDKQGWGGYAIAAVLIGGATAAFFSMDDGGPETLDVTVPAGLSAQARAGQTAFNRTCSTCHGENAAGGEGGPPLIHKIYEPGHHADGAIRNAVMLGVRQHHWSFGNMPPQPGINGADINAITAFLRETQRANGIR